MISSLHNPPVIQHHDHIRIFDCGKPVGDHKYRPAFHQPVHAILHDFFRAGINAGLQPALPKLRAYVKVLSCDGCFHRLKLFLLLS